MKRSPVKKTREEMPFHPAANIFPLDDENLGSLADDIRSNGQQVPIESMDGMVLDGRRRWLACSLAQVEPKTRTVSVADPVAYVLSLNLHRRHLTPSQLSMVAARARELYDQQAKERQREHGKTAPGKNTSGKFTGSDARDAAGKAVGVSGRTVDFATKVLTHGTPELVKAVDEGRMAVSTAAIYASEPPEVQREVVSDPKRKRTYKPGVGRRPKISDSKEEDELPEGESRGVGVQRANEAINCLRRIPKNDRLRKRGFQIVTDWIRHNR